MQKHLGNQMKCPLGREVSTFLEFRLKSLPLPPIPLHPLPLPTIIHIAILSTELGDLGTSTRAGPSSRSCPWAPSQSWAQGGVLPEQPQTLTHQPRCSKTSSSTLPSRSGTSMCLCSPDLPQTLQLCLLWPRPARTVQAHHSGHTFCPGPRCPCGDGPQSHGNHYTVPFIFWVGIFAAGKRVWQIKTYTGTQVSSHFCIK